MKLRWPWRTDPEPSPETLKLQEKLKEVQKDDSAVRELSMRAKRIMKQNHLAADIAKALGIR